MRRIRSLLYNRSGNVAMMFAIAAVPLMIAAGAAVDMVRANNSETMLQNAADAAALAGASSSVMTGAKLNEIVQNYVTSNDGYKALDKVRVVSWKLDKPNRKFQVRIEGTLNTTLMRLAGIDVMQLNAESQVDLGANGLEVALVLDNTGSMNSDNRLPTLKSSAKALVDEVLKDNGMTYVKVGVVPFSEYVNVGLGNRTASWIDVPADTSTTAEVCSDTYPNAVASNCTSQTGTLYTDGQPSTYSYETCDWNYGTPVQVCSNQTTTQIWGGCVGSRSTSLDTRIDQLNKPYEGVMNVRCPVPLMPLTSDKASLYTMIDGMVGVGNTYIPSGLLWGWNMLDDAEPIIGAKSKSWMKSNGGTKALVLMTDGDNTISADYPYHWGSNISISNAKVTELCDNIKKDGIVIYTVSLAVTNQVSKSMLADCASDGKKAFAAEDSADLAQAFREISESLLAMRLSK